MIIYICDFDLRVYFYYRIIIINCYEYFMFFKVNMNNYYGKKRMIYNVNIYYKLAYDRDKF